MLEREGRPGNSSRTRAVCSVTQVTAPITDVLLLNQGCAWPYIPRTKRRQRIALVGRADSPAPCRHCCAHLSLHGVERSRFSYELAVPDARENVSATSIGHERRRSHVPTRAGNHRRRRGNISRARQGRRTPRKGNGHCWRDARSACAAPSAVAPPAQPLPGAGTQTSPRSVANRPFRQGATLKPQTTVRS